MLSRWSYGSAKRLASLLNSLIYFFTLDFILYIVFVIGFHLIYDESLDSTERRT